MKFHGLTLLALVTATAIGCGDATSTPRTATTPFLLSAEPTGAKDVAAAKSDTADGEEVVLVGKIAGSADPFVKDMAAFTLVDLAVPHCAPEEGCPTPWDCCCHMDEAKAKQALVQVVNDDGQVVETDARDLLGVQGLSEVVVRGKAQKDDQGNLTVLASKVFVRK